MTNNDFVNRMNDAVKCYYHFNPDTLMPMLLLALAAQGKLSVKRCKERPENAAVCLRPVEMKELEWVRLNENLKLRVDEWIEQGTDLVCVDMDLGRSLMPIYNIFKQNDEVTVVQEFHHRIGRLVDHSAHSVSDEVQRQYATFLLAETMLYSPVAMIQGHYFEIFNEMLELSGLQPKRPRMDVAKALNYLLEYDGGGCVYNPFAGCSIAGAMVGAMDNFYGDGDTNYKLYAVGLLLNYGMGISNENFLQRDSKLWLRDRCIDYVLSTFTGFVDGESAFDFCLGKCLEDKDFKGKYAGMVQPKEIFEKQTQNWLEALQRDWIAAIVLLPFGEAAVLVDADKDARMKGRIRFVNGAGQLACNAPIDRLMTEDMYSMMIDAEDVEKAGYLKRLVMPDLQEKEGYRKVRLGDIVRRKERKVYDLSEFDEEDRNMVPISRNDKYRNAIKSEKIEANVLYNPAYFLNGSCLLVNMYGKPEPRLYDAICEGCAFFEDGFAFEVNPLIDVYSLQDELNETYVYDQLHPYGMNDMVPEPVTEDDYLNLTVYDRIPEEERDDYSDEQEEEEQWNVDSLENGYVLKDGYIRYTIIKFIDGGGFAYTYKALMENCRTGEKEIVAIKEFYPAIENYIRRVNNRVVVDELVMDDFNNQKDMFYKEYDILASMRDVPDCHLTEVKSIFDCEATGTAYYVMKYYARMSLLDMINAGEIPDSEQLVIRNIVVPMCKALNAIHSRRILHLDIKPNNIVIDDNDEAVLIDFGTAQLYDENDRNTIERRSVHSTINFSAPENTGGNMKYFCPQSDIYSIAACFYTMLTYRDPEPFNYNTRDGLEYDLEDCSDKMKRAILEGMREFVNDRPRNVQEFLNMFPGCEDVKL